MENLFITDKKNYILEWFQKVLWRMKTVFLVVLFQCNEKNEVLILRPLYYFKQLYVFIIDSCELQHFLS